MGDIKRLYPVVLAVISPALINPVWAADDAVLLERVQRLEYQLQLRDQVIRNLLDRVHLLEEKQQATESAAPLITGNAPAPTQVPGEDLAADSGNAAPEVWQEEDRLARLRASAAFERQLVQHGGLLLPSGVWELEPSITYAHSSSDHIYIDGFTVAQVLVVGDIVNERVNRDYVEAALTGRLGLPSDNQIEVRLPYAYVQDEFYNPQEGDRRDSTAAFGDAEIAWSHQFDRHQGGNTNLLGSLRWRIPTGEDPYRSADGSTVYGLGYHSVQAALTSILTSDPVVFYGGVSYTANLPVDRDIGRIDPGDSAGYQVGIAMSVNMDTSLSFGWEQRYTWETEVDNQEIPGTSLTSGSLAIGVTHTTYLGTTYDVRANIGLTRDSPDAQITLAVPFRH